MNIYFDNIIFSLQKSGGISVVWKELIDRILKEGSLFKIRFIGHLFDNDNIFKSSLYIPINHFIYNKKYFWGERYLDVKVNDSEKFIFHSSYYRLCCNSNCINITTVHDFTYEYYASGLKKNIHKWQKYRAIRKSDYIICISESTKSDLLKFLPDVDENKIKVIYNGVSDAYHLSSVAFSERLPFCKNSYVLFVGSRAKYKNFYLSARAVSKTRYNFLIVGPSLNRRERNFLRKAFCDISRFKCMDRVSNESLNILYNNAFALLYPSVYEGFGIPVLEAQKAGCPVIAYNSSSIPEIVGDTAFLINNSSIKEIDDYILLLEDVQQRNHLIEKGLVNVKKFSWENMYSSVLSLYKEAWNSK